jgi:hypothetical protein
MAARRNWAGRNGLKTPVEISPKSRTPPTGRCTVCNMGEFCMTVTSGQLAWAAATAVKSRANGCGESR